MSKLLTQNSKFKKTSKKHAKRVFNWGIPAYQSASGFKTCPNAAACAVGCYAQSGAYRFSNVAAAFERRLEAAQARDFVPTMIAEIKQRRADVIRIHDSGDFFSAHYARQWLDICDALPDVQFYAYTKEVSMFKLGAKHLPANLTIIFSYGGRQDKLIDPETDRHARVFETVAELKAAGYVDASDDDLAAIGSCKKIGLVYHGNKSYNNTHWSRVKSGSKTSNLGE